jgi:hypothetical protein
MPLDSDEFIPSDRPRSTPGPQIRPGRPWIGLRFVCAGAYQRVYRNPQGTAYIATCPRCGRSLRIDVGPGGTNQRFFDVSC